MEQKKKGRTGEIIRFVIAGGGCFLIELGTFTLLNRVLGWGTVVSTSIAFLVSVIANYLLCIYWVFRGDKNTGNAAKVGFLITSCVGWLLNVVLMLLFNALWGEETVLFTLFGKEINIILLNKCLATLLVMIWNYISKRAVLTRKAKKQ